MKDQKETAESRNIEEKNNVLSVNILILNHGSGQFQYLGVGTYHPVGTFPLRCNFRYGFRA